MNSEPPNWVYEPANTLSDSNKIKELVGLQEFLSAEGWVEKEIPPADRLLGDFITTTTRSFLVGATGMGKTLLGLGLAQGMASGQGFLHWQSTRPARVLYVDGEMPSELIKARVADALRRGGGQGVPGNLFIIARDDEDEFAKRFPSIGRFAPLNTKEGQTFILELIGKLGGVDAVVFDNVMSLIAGDQKDEVPWSETLPLVTELTKMRVGQVWCDHTGHDRGRQYGSSTKAWRFDAVGIMTALPDAETAPGELAFTLSFDHPGKARRRTPENWRDFETRTIRLADDRWTSESAGDAKKVAMPKLSPKAKQFYHSLLDALAISDVPGKTTKRAWFAECVRVGMADALADSDDYATRDRKQREFRKYLSMLKAGGLIGVNGDDITHLKQR